VVGWIAVLWQAIGVATYLNYVDLLGPSDPYAVRLPVVIHACYAIGVFVGLLGALALALRQRWAWLPLWVSLLALIVHWGWLFINGPEVSVALGVTVLAVAVVLVWLAERTRRPRQT
jgi:hypothetical protein